VLVLVLTAATGALVTGCGSELPAQVTATTLPTPSEATTGPRVADPERIDPFEVAEPMTISDVVVAGNVLVRPGADLVLDHVEVEGTIVFVVAPFQPKTKLHADGVVASGLYATTTTNGGDVYDLDYKGPGSEVPAELVVTNSYFNNPPAAPPDHTEALAGFGWIKGARFVNTAFIQQGPNNLTQTAAVNWHGSDTVFERCYFGWDPSGEPAAFYAVYVSGPRNVVRDSEMEIGMDGGGYIYPDPDKGGDPASYSGNVDAFSGDPVTLEAEKRRPTT
jgi:hypothetical protein